MPVLLDRRRWQRKPEGIRLRLDPSHPFAGNLIGAWLMNELVGSTVWDYGLGRNHGTIVGNTVTRTRGP